MPVFITFRVIFLITLLAHVALLMYEHEVSLKSKPRNKPQNQSRVRIISNPDRVKTNDSKGIGYKSGEDCKSWFYGFGVTHDLHTGKIGTVKEGYPAHRAGIKVGDKLISILDIYGNDMQYTSPAPEDPSYNGQSATIIVERNGQSLSFTLQRERICTDKE